MRLTRRIYCRIFQTVFRAALPVLPYRNPKIIPAVVRLGAINSLPRPAASSRSGKSTTESESRNWSEKAVK